MAKTTKAAAVAKKAAAAPAKKAAAPVKKAANSMAQNNDETALRSLFIKELQDIYWAEKHLTKALPKMRKSATSTELAAAFEDHLEVTQNQVSRIEQVFEMLGEKARAKKCDAMEGLVEEAKGLMEELPKGTAVIDAGLIAAGQKVEHYEIATYGTLVQWAKTLGMEDIAGVLQETLDEEKQTDALLTELAVTSINLEAEGEPAEDEEE